VVIVGDLATVRNGNALGGGAARGADGFHLLEVTWKRLIFGTEMKHMNCKGN
jgi:hypothetical protein